MDTIANAFKHLHNRSPFTVSAYKPLDPRRLDEFTVPGNVPDARYKIHLLAASTDYRGAIVRYKHARYHVAVIGDAQFVVTPA